MNARLLSLTTVVVLSSWLTACQSPGPLPGSALPDKAIVGSAAEMGGNLYRAVEEHVRSQGSDLNETPHQSAYTDLNNDGFVDVLLMLNAPEWCIGESCTLMVFEGTVTGARLLAELTLISSPISVGDIVGDGWRDLYVTLPGSAGNTTMAKIVHDGQQYPESPSQWSFLADATTLPGRAVLVGGGASGTDLAGFNQLLSEVDADTEVATVARTSSLSTSDEQSFYGRYSWGPGEAYFRPCGGSSVYWVNASEAVAAELDQQYRQIARLQFDDVYLEMKGESKPAPKEGEASFYDGVLEIEQVVEMDAVDENTCSQVPTS